MTPAGPRKPMKPARRRGRRGAAILPAAAFSGGFWTGHTRWPDGADTLVCCVETLLDAFRRAPSPRHRARFRRSPPPRPWGGEGHGHASYTILKGVSVARRKRWKPAVDTTLWIRASPACAPRHIPTSCDREHGVHSSVENE